jgi:bacillithiol system protein YtxJ
MVWEHLASDNDLSDNLSSFIIFKHSPRCSISNMAKSRFERNWPNGLNIPVFLINVTEQRELSNYVQAYYNVKHESPQVLLIKNGKCIFSDSHNGINVSTLTENL